MSTLIAYFSHTGENIADGSIVILDKGNTEKVAEKIHSIVGGDLYKIVEAEPYPFSYRECNNRAKREDENSERPALLDTVGLDLSKYDTIYLGFPIWYRTYPRVVATFIDKYDFSGKTIIPFTTNDEEQFGVSLLELQAQLKNAEIKQGLVIKGINVDNSDDVIKQFCTK